MLFQILLYLEQLLHIVLKYNNIQLNLKSFLLNFLYPIDLRSQTHMLVKPSHSYPTQKHI